MSNHNPQPPNPNPDLFPSPNLPVPLRSFLPTPASVRDSSSVSDHTVHIYSSHTKHKLPFHNRKIISVYRTNRNLQSTLIISKLSVHGPTVRDCLVLFVQSVTRQQASVHSGDLLVEQAIMCGFWRDHKRCIYGYIIQITYM